MITYIPKSQKLDAFLKFARAGLVPKRIKETVHREGKTFPRERIIMVKPEDTEKYEVKDTRNELVGSYTVSSSWKDNRPKPEEMLKNAGFRYYGEERRKRGSPLEEETVHVFLHPILGPLEIYSGPEREATFEGEKTFERERKIVNPAPDFKPDLRDPKTLSLTDRIVSRQKFLNRFMDGEARNRWEERAKRYGIHVDELKERTLKKILPLIEKSDVWIRVPLSRLSSIIAMGRFHSLSESKIMGPGKTVRINKYLPARNEEEEKLFGIGKKIIDGGRPIYGYLSDNSDGYNPLGEELQDIDIYGTVAIKLSSSVRTKTTFTVGDSLDLNLCTLGGRVIPSKLNDPKAESVLGDMLDLEKPMSSIFDLTDDYVEAQIHGVNVSDIDEVVFYERPSQNTLKKLNKSGISHRTIYRKKLR